MTTFKDWDDETEKMTIEDLEKYGKALETLLEWDFFKQAYNGFGLPVVKSIALATADRKRAAKVRAENREVANLPGMSGAEVVRELKKIEMAIYIADTLFGKHLSGDASVGPKNWKVKELVKMKKSPDLDDLYKMAKRVRRGTANATILDQPTVKIRRDPVCGHYLKD